MPTNTDYWDALASRLGQRLSTIPGEASAAAGRLRDAAGAGLRTAGNAGVAFSQLPLTAARTIGSAARSFADAARTGENPYEVAGPTDAEIMPGFADVQAGASMAAQPSVPQPPVLASAPPRVVQMPGSIRYQLPGGEWKEFKTGDTAPTISEGTISDPANPLRPHSYTPTSGGGTVSMMTAPQNAGIVTEASRMDDYQRALNEKLARMTIENPGWREQAKSDAKVNEAVAIEQGKADIARSSQEQIMHGIEQNDAQIDSDLAQQLSEAQRNPAFAQLSKEQRDQIIGAAKAEADDAKRAYRERVGIATGNVSVAMRPGAAPMGF